ncbi:MAG: DUF362 domain-containing protein [Elusimicrobiales bacterium]|nr:DUF362 domain-containing protein [Elusimicrobiales bacterium]
MEKAKVYFTSMRAATGDSLPDKLKRLIKTAGIGRIDFKNHFAAIKIHFGEPGNLAYLRPNYAAAVADVIKELGGKPFLTDCNTLYVGGRKNALDHIDSAYKNGFFPIATGCQIIIADGLKGTDEAEVPVRGGKHVKAAKIGRAIMDADIVISLSHFKGHELTGFGGALKNIGMGCGSRAGKMDMHSAGKPRVSREKCIGCGKCRKTCQVEAPEIKDRKCTINQEICLGCGRCIGVCPVDAIYPDYRASNEVLNGKMAEYAMAVLDGRPNFHISLAIDISPCCDCHSENDAPVVADIGMFASFDPVALDRACIDAVNAAKPLPDTALSEAWHNEGDHFHKIFPSSDWKLCLNHAEELGLGTQQYELIMVK